MNQIKHQNKFKSDLRLISKQTQK